MNEANSQYLLGRYPKLYQGYNLPMTQTCMCRGFECGDGWASLLDRLSAKITEFDKLNGTQTIATQVKEKYGTLRFYIESAPDALYDIIDDAEDESAKTCEDCGKPGELRDGSWVRTLCDDCFYGWKKGE